MLRLRGGGGPPNFIAMNKITGQTATYVYTAGYVNPHIKGIIASLKEKLVKQDSKIILYLKDKTDVLKDESKTV